MTTHAWKMGALIAFVVIVGSGCAADMRAGVHAYGLAEEQSMHTTTELISRCKQGSNDPKSCDIASRSTTSAAAAAHVLQQISPTVPQ